VHRWRDSDADPGTPRFSVVSRAPRRRARGLDGAPSGAVRHVKDLQIRLSSAVARGWVVPFRGRFRPIVATDSGSSPRSRPGSAVRLRQSRRPKIGSASSVSRLGSANRNRLV
jgi:hypothetical protein